MTGYWCKTMDGWRVWGVLIACRYFVGLSITGDGSKIVGMVTIPTTRPGGEK